MWDNWVLRSLPVPHLSFSWATVMVLGKGSVPTKLSISAELQPDCMLASAQEDGYPSGLLPSIGPSSQRQGFVQNRPLLLPRPPSLSCESTPPGSSSRTKSEHSLEEIRCKLFLPGTRVAFNRFAAPWKKTEAPLGSQAGMRPASLFSGTPQALNWDCRGGQKQEKHGDRCHCSVLFLPESVIPSRSKRPKAPDIYASIIFVIFLSILMNFQ